MSQPTFLALSDYNEYPVEGMKRAAEFLHSARQRRTVSPIGRCLAKSSRIA
jgi:hypothetical protein